MPQSQHPDLFEEMHDDDQDALVPAGAAPWWLQVPAADATLALTTEAAALQLRR